MKYVAAMALFILLVTASMVIATNVVPVYAKDVKSSCWAEFEPPSSTVSCSEGDKDLRKDFGFKPNQEARDGCREVTDDKCKRQ